MLNLNLVSVDDIVSLLKKSSDETEDFAFDLIVFF